MNFFASRPVEFWDETRTISNIQISSLNDLLLNSKASQAFKDALNAFINKPEQSEFIQYPKGTPPIKIIRVVQKLLEQFPEKKIDYISIVGSSGCSSFDGEIRVEPENARYRFTWDCNWRAKENDVRNDWGMRDQAKAAYDFGYQCFRVFEEI